MNKSRKCPVCSSTSPIEIYSNELAPIGGYQLSNTIAACNECGFVYCDRIPEHAVYSDYYANLSKYDLQGSGVNLVDQLRINHASALISDVSDMSAEVFDIGCGNGALLRKLKTLGFQKLGGVDPSWNSPKCAKTYDIPAIWRGSVDDFDLHLIKDADVVFIMAVIEHLITPRRAIKRLVSGMKTGAKLIIEVPSLDLFDGSSGEPLGELSLEHIQFFSLDSLKNMMVGLDLTLVEYSELTLPHSLGSLFAVFECAPEAAIEYRHASGDALLMKHYINESNAKLARCLESLNGKKFILYGAGAHSARLVPILEKKGIAVQAIVDGNPNYLGETLGEIEIQDPEVISRMPETPILISSFRSEAVIKASCKGRFANKIVTLYGS